MTRGQVTWKLNQGQAWPPPECPGRDGSTANLGWARILVSQLGRWPQCQWDMGSREMRLAQLVGGKPPECAVWETVQHSGPLSPWPPLGKDTPLMGSVQKPHPIPFLRRNHPAAHPHPRLLSPGDDTLGPLLRTRLKCSNTRPSPAPTLPPCLPVLPGNTRSLTTLHLRHWTQPQRTPAHPGPQPSESRPPLHSLGHHLTSFLRSLC